MNNKEYYKGNLPVFWSTLERIRFLSVSQTQPCVYFADIS